MSDNEEVIDNGEEENYESNTQKKFEEKASAPQNISKGMSGQIGNDEELIDQESEDEQQQYDKKLYEKQQVSNPIKESDEEMLDRENNKYNEQEPEITDPKVKRLYDLNLDTTKKEDIIRMLLDKDLLNPNPEHNENIDQENMRGTTQSQFQQNLNRFTMNKANQKKQVADPSQYPPLPGSNKKKKNYGYNKGNRANDPYYDKTQSNVKAYINQKANKGVERFHAYMDEEFNPEYTKDFNAATSQLTEKMEGNEDPDNQIYKILNMDLNIPGLNFGNQDYGTNQNPFQKKRVYTITKEEIGEKVNQALNHKKETIEKIKNKWDEEFKAKLTFTPNINNKEERRDFNQFLAEQQLHMDKVKSKINDLGKAKNEKKNEEGYKFKPDKHSEDLFKEKIKDQKPAFERLYNKEYVTGKGVKNKEKEQIKKEKEMKDKENKDAKNDKKKIPSKQGFSVGKEKKTIIQRPIVSKSPKKNQNKSVNKELKNNAKPVKYILTYTDLPGIKLTNKTFEDRINGMIEEYEKSIQKEEKENNKQVKEGEVNNQNDKMGEVKKLDKLNKAQLYDLLFYLGMISKMSPEENPEEMTGINQMKEKQLANDMWESMKDTKNEVPIENVKKFLSCVFGFLPYTLYQEFKARPDFKELDKQILETNPEMMKDEKIEKYIIRQDQIKQDSVAKEDIKNRNNKYVAYDQSGNMFVPLKNNKKIKNEFLIFTINHNNMLTSIKANNKNQMINNMYDPNGNMLFKPQIDKKSQEYSMKFRERIMKNEDGSGEKKCKIPQMEYIDRIVMQRKKKIAENEKLHEEISNKELEQCTFKPKLECKSTIKKNVGANRFNEMYIKGTEILKNRKDKTKDEIELEKMDNECKFKPNIKKPETKEEVKFENDIYNEKSYQMFYERIKQGKNERLIKEAINDRYGLDENLQEYIKKGKGKEFNYYNGNVTTEGEGPTDRQDNPNVVNKSGYGGYSGSYNNTYGNSSANSNANSNQKQGKKYGGSNNSNSQQNKQEDGNSKNDNNIINNENKGADNINNNNPDGANKDEDGAKKDGAIPTLIIDVNIREGVKKKIYVYDHDTPQELAEKFAAEHNLEPQTKEKLQILIQSHMNRLLTRIDEENQSISGKSAETRGQKPQ